MIDKGIILAGGTGSRLHPVTQGVSKQLVPVYDKPMVYYPLATLMLAGLRQVLVITTPEDQHQFERLLGDGESWGIRICYAAQERPEGLAQAFLIGKEFIDGDPCALVLGDNIFYGGGLRDQLVQAAQRREGATVFGYRVKNPSDYGVAEINADGECIGIEEKPEHPKSSYAVTGLYFYDDQVVELAESLVPSARNELEITDLNMLYLRQKQLHLIRLGRGVAWLDTGTHDSLLEAAHFVQAIQNRQGTQVACPEEIAFENGWIDERRLTELARPLAKTEYGRYLLTLAEGH